MWITIQDLDDAATKWILEEAQRRGISTEQLTLELIHQGIRVERANSVSRTDRDLDSLAGTWTEEQADEFLRAVADFEQVDERLWR